MPKPIGTMSMQRIYALYLQKITRKGRQQAELDEVLTAFTGVPAATLQNLPETETVAEFCQRAPWRAEAAAITGVVCGVRVETSTDPLMRRVRELDKVVDELAKGRPVTKIIHRGQH
ncbi:DUF2200 family protein [Lacticaseibacillus zhaodongensis]|uniref:DUF2200 family protein n=1 Tax=Lacticaseibacillus zhaodongensis TaxID=2668065 RepID=UPI0012D31B82|nr:DUF2200 family protein [Lacticaseibacillus zhaodongensis]